MRRDCAFTLDALDRERNALPNTYAHRGQRSFCSRFLQLVHGGQHQTRAAHSEWMAERNSPAVRVDVRRVIRNSELPQAGKRLTSERLIQFDEVKTSNGEL